MTDSIEQGTPLPGLPGGLAELERYLDTQNVPEVGRRIVREAFTSNPKRRVGGGARNMVVRFASRKMGCVIQCESRTVERAFVGRCEHDPKIHLFLCQAVQLSVPIVDSKNRKRLVTVTLDYLVYHEHQGFLLVECKPEPELEKSPRFERDGDRWRWPAAEKVAAELGLKLWVFSSEEINPLWLRNMDFLADFVGVDCPDRALADALLDRVRQVRSVRVSMLLELMGDRTEVLWWLVANHRLSADFERELVFDRDWAWIHDSPERMIARREHRVTPDAAKARLAARPQVLRIEPNARVHWDGVPWRVLNRGSDKVTLQRDDATGALAELALSDVETLLKRGALRRDDDSALKSMSKAREALVLQASPAQLKAATARFQALEHAQHHGGPPAGVTSRSIRRYKRRAAEGEQRLASSYIGLISKRGRPRGTSTLAPVQQQAIDEAVADYLVPARKPSLAVSGGDFLLNLTANP